jgi:hypothetical protein
MKTLTASKGMFLTNGDTYVSKVTLGKNDSEANWAEVSEKPPEMEILTPEEELADAKAALISLGVKKVTTWEAAAKAELHDKNELTYVKQS